MNKKTIVLWIITILWMGIIFSFSTNDGYQSTSTSKKVTYDMINIVEKKKTESEKMEKVEILHPQVRKIAHAFEYAVLYILVISSLKTSNIKVNKIYLIALVICILYAITDEVHQLFVSGRSGELKDVIIDTAGATIGLMFFNLTHRLLYKKKNKS